MTRLHRGMTLKSLDPRLRGDDEPKYAHDGQKHSNDKRKATGR